MKKAIIVIGLEKTFGEGAWFTTVIADGRVIYQTRSTSPLGVWCGAHCDEGKGFHSFYYRNVAEFLKKEGFKEVSLLLDSRVIEVIDGQLVCIPSAKMYNPTGFRMMFESFLTKEGFNFSDDPLPLEVKEELFFRMKGVVCNNEKVKTGLPVTIDSLCTTHLDDVCVSIGGHRNYVRIDDLRQVRSVEYAWYCKTRFPFVEEILPSGEIVVLFPVNAKEVFLHWKHWEDFELLELS